MTVKEIAEFTGKTERCIRNWVIKAAENNSPMTEKMSVSNSTHPADYTIDEVESILTSGSMSKDAVSILMENARKPATTQVTGSTLTQKDIELITAITAGVVSKVMENMSSRVSNIESKFEERKALLPPPSVSPRQNVSRIVREYATNKNMGFKEAYTMLYTDFGYRTHMNVSQRAKNRGMAKMDYIEAEGMIGTLEAVAIDIMRDTDNE